MLKTDWRSAPSGTHDRKEKKHGKKRKISDSDRETREVEEEEEEEKINGSRWEERYIGRKSDSL